MTREKRRPATVMLEASRSMEITAPGSASTSAEIACPSSWETRAAGSPSAVQFPEKISANDSPMNALIPMRIQRLRRVLAGRAAAEVPADHQEGAALETRVVEGMLPFPLVAGGPGLLGPFLVESLVVEGVLPQRLEGDLPQVAPRDDPVRVDVVTGQRDPAPLDLQPRCGCRCGCHTAPTVRASTTSPAGRRRPPWRGS